MNPDETPPPPAGQSPSSGARSNLKNRWKPGLHRGSAPVQLRSGENVRPSTALGEVTDLATARESLSGQHARGYEQPATDRLEPAVKPSRSEPVEATPPNPAPDRPPLRGESHSQEREFRGRDHERDRERSPQNREAPSPQHEFRSQHRETRPENRPENSPTFSTPVPDRQPRPPSQGRDAASKEYIALKPDPANDPAPRRQRTDLPRPPVPIQDYFPSTRNHNTEKSIPAKGSQHSSRRHRDPGPPTKPQPDATISVHVSSSRDEKPKSKPKSRSIFGFIKRALGITGESFYDKAPALAESSSRHSSHRSSSSSSSSRRDSSSEEPRSTEHRRKSNRRHSPHGSHSSYGSRGSRDSDR